LPRRKRNLCQGPHRVILRVRVEKKGLSRNFMVIWGSRVRPFLASRGKEVKGPKNFARGGA